MQPGKRPRSKGDGEEAVVKRSQQAAASGAGADAAATSSRGSKAKKVAAVARVARKTRLQKRTAGAAATSIATKPMRAVDLFKKQGCASINWKKSTASAAGAEAKPRKTGKKRSVAAGTASSDSKRIGSGESHKVQAGQREKANPWFDTDDEDDADLSRGKPQKAGAAKAKRGKGAKNAVAALGLKRATTKNLITGHMEGPTKHIALDCEMVGVGPHGRDSALARVCLVNSHGNIILDKMVKTKERIIDYRTFVSGIRPDMMKDAEPFETVQKDVGKILKGRILVGHALRNDLQALVLSHPQKDIRDTSKFNLFRKISKGRTPALKTLFAHHFELEIQTGEHSPAEDAQAAMLLFKKFKTKWDKSRRKGTDEDDGEKKGGAQKTNGT